MKDSFIRYILDDCLGGISGITSRAMFGGYGLYKDGIIFGIVVEDKVYFKYGEDTQHLFEEFKSKPFTYEGPHGKTYAMSYYEVPEEVLEDKVIIGEWVRAAVSSSQKSKSKS